MFRYTPRAVPRYLKTLCCCDEHDVVPAAWQLTSYAVALRTKATYILKAQGTPHPTVETFTEHVLLRLSGYRLPALTEARVFCDIAPLGKHNFPLKLPEQAIFDSCQQPNFHCIIGATCSLTG